MILSSKSVYLNFFRGEKMSNSHMPIARTERLVIQEMPGEILVYDLETDKAHCLNRTAAAVWKFCDGKNTVADIRRRLAETSGKPVGEDLIWLAIDCLNESRLLENQPPVFVNRNRREVIKKIGLAAVVALPLITSLVAPKAAHAGSTCNFGGACACTSGSASCSASASNCNVNCSSCSNGVCA